jgi:hypothetical protein
MNDACVTGRAVWWRNVGRVRSAAVRVVFEVTPRASRVVVVRVIPMMGMRMDMVAARRTVRCAPARSHAAAVLLRWTRPMAKRFVELGVELLLFAHINVVVVAR